MTFFIFLKALDNNSWMLFFRKRVIRRPKEQELIRFFRNNSENAK